ncbi:Meiotic coiled-coil protein-like protein [Hapsidospora chrysogenum ATCC 11550]|uniref:Meiotic coiled-coil protein-like protein n=1 Tax=Hapsidospora chrysogenum (strain ATCC 11550 / CBS 779.69 / DSM 880 / IAM 14645 / JCM 23072 / IMI 49137) TaxID=857340 RepID=A0A086SWZ2_HAPC1|nr:Meiotic coiled-coil protein-like protein [Hapsidospora chrysogenum ATCC 11550]
MTSKLANLAGPKKFKAGTEPSDSDSTYPMDKLLAKLSEQQAVLNQQNEALKSGDNDGFGSKTRDQDSSSNSLPITPATDGFSTTAPMTRPASATTVDDTLQDADEVLRLKLQLAQAQNYISKLDHELAQSRTTKTDMEPIGSGGTRNKTATSTDNTWPTTEDGHSDTSENLSASTFNWTRSLWANTKANIPNGPIQGPVPEPSQANWFGTRGLTPGYIDPNVPCRFDTRMNSPHQFGGSYGGFNPPGAPYDALMASPMPGGPVPAGPMSGPHGMGPMGIGMYPPGQQAMGTQLSPYASEITSKSGWKSEMISPEGPTYLPPTEPLNYRRLLDRNVNCNWKYIVDKIVCNNDQQASIFLQQKLKVGTPEQKYEIVEAIVAQAYPLMVNRFGNFLVQRCFEHGTPEQVIKIAEAIRGNTLNLSMDPFGCHVVQKAFDSVPEDYKAIMVHELLRRIPETVIHRYACHVWQKLFELRWTATPPQIMKYVNEALRGMWHEVALGETGSLVVQNIFENCLEEDKRPCIEEVLANIDIVAHGQFGNWCIQHICEHGAPPDRSRAIDHVIRYAAEYSTDQFASKVVEKCLKIGGAEFLGRYLDRVCEGRRDRPRIPLIDIASDQYGNYLVQWILNNATPQHREMVAAHIRKHMVSLRGSKFGSRVGMLCTNHAVTTRPGPGVGPGMGGSRMGPVTRFGGGGSTAPSYR